MKEFVLPNMPVGQYLMPLVKGVWNHAEKKPASGTAIRNWIKEGTIQINGEKADFSEVLDYPIFSIVIFPNSSSKRITIF